MMKISIVTVSFNSALTIGDTLRSVAAQRYPDIEHIVIDGASRDATPDVVRTLGAHVKHFISEPDNGICDAMNKGIALATGGLIGFLNADDVFASPDSVTSMAAAVSANDSDAVYSDLVYVRADSTDKVVRRWCSGEYSRSRLRYGWMPPHPTFYVRSHVMRQVGPFDQRLRSAADYDFVLHCLAQPERRVAYLPEVLVRMRLGGASNHSVQAVWRKSREGPAGLATQRRRRDRHVALQEPAENSAIVALNCHPDAPECSSAQFSCERRGRRARQDTRL